MPKSLFGKSFWVKLFALKPSFFFKTRFLQQSRRASTIQRHIITIFSKPCQVNRRGLVSKPDGLGDPTPTLRCGSLWIDKSTALWDHPLLFKTGSKKKRNRDLCSLRITLRCPVCYKHTAPLGLCWFISNKVDFG